MVGTGILSINMRSPSAECYSTFWMMTIYSDTSIDQALHQFLTILLIWTLLPNLTFYLILRGVHRTFATGAACQQRKLSPLDTWSCPTLGLASVLMLRPISPELVLFPDFEFRTSLGSSVLTSIGSTVIIIVAKVMNSCKYVCLFVFNPVFLIKSSWCIWL